jgi:ketosteroid isomerase-like protein
MSQENVEIVRRASEAFNRDGPEAVLAWLAPDVEWHDLPDQPDAGVYHGHAGFLAAMEQFLLPFEDLRVEIVEIVDLGDQAVVCLRNIGRGGGSGAGFEQRVVGLWTLRNGFVVRVVWFRTREEALKTVGLSE